MQNVMAICCCLHICYILHLDLGISSPFLHEYLKILMAEYFYTLQIHLSLFSWLKYWTEVPLLHISVLHSSIHVTNRKKNSKRSFPVSIQRFYLNGSADDDITLCEKSSRFSSWQLLVQLKELRIYQVVGMATKVRCACTCLLSVQTFWCKCLQMFTI